MPAVANLIATITLRSVFHGYASWDPIWVAIFGHTRLKEPDADDYCRFAKYELLKIDGVLSANVDADVLTVVFDPHAVNGLPPTFDAEKAHQMAKCRVLSVCVRHGLWPIEESLA